MAHFSDGTGVVDLVWFQGIKFIIGKYKVHEEYIVFGKPTVFGGRINVAHPDICLLYTSPFVEAAKVARKLGIGLNAGHDLSLVNLNFFYKNIPWLDEVSIGHALISDALYLGLERTIQEYKNCLR